MGKQAKVRKVLVNDDEWKWYAKATGDWSESATLVVFDPDGGRTEVKQFVGEGEPITPAMVRAYIEECLIPDEYS